MEHANTCHKHVSMPMSPQTKAEWAGILMGLSDSQRRVLLSLAIATEGLDLVQMPQHLSGLRKMLEPVTKPVYPGASRRIFQAAFHRGALQVRSVSTEFMGAQGRAFGPSKCLQDLDLDPDLALGIGQLHLDSCCCHRNGFSLGRATSMLLLLHI